jgi:aminopeptidase N
MRGRFFIINTAMMLSTLFLLSCSASEELSVVRQEIAVTILPDSHEIEGSTRIVMKRGRANRLSLTLADDASVKKASLDGEPVPFTFIGSVLSVDLDNTSTRKEPSLEILYRCPFDDHPPPESISGEDPTYGVNAVISRVGTFLGPGAGWYPAPAIMPKKRVVRVTAPAGMEAITAGKRVYHEVSAKATTSVWEETHPAGALSLSAAGYTIGEGSVDGFPIYTYFNPDNASFSKLYLDAGARYLEFYQGLFGNYPFEKFAVVENFFPTGYGFPSYTLLGSSIIRLPFIPDTSLPHEIAHCWWGNGVLVDEKGGNWSEGLVTYLSDYLLEERKSPQAARDYRSILLTDYASLVTPDREFPLREFTSRIDPPSRCIGYGKGMMVFHMLRKEIGDELFFKGLREIYRKKLFQMASWDDLFKTFSKISGKDLKGFKIQWLDRGGGPRISFAGVTEQFVPGKWTVSGEIIQTGPIYSFPITLELRSENGNTRKTLEVERERTRFSFTVTSSPRRLLLDPDRDLFRILSRQEIPPAINRVKGSQNLVAVVSPKFRGNRKNIETLLEFLGQRGAEIISEGDATRERLADHDILVFGYSDRWRLAKGIGAAGFAIDGESYNRPEDALFTVELNPEARDRVVALFVPLSEKGASSCIPKITHYGKYGLVAFRSGRNVVKRVAEVQSAGVSSIDFQGGR